MAQYSRGTQMSLVGYEPILLCRSCDERMIAWSRGGRPVPFSYRSSALEKIDGDQDSGTDGGGNVLLTP